MVFEEAARYSFKEFMAPPLEVVFEEWVVISPKSRNVGVHPRPEVQRPTPIDMTELDEEQVPLPLPRSTPPPAGRFMSPSAASVRLDRGLPLRHFVPSGCSDDGRFRGPSLRDAVALTNGYAHTLRVPSPSRPFPHPHPPSAPFPRRQPHPHRSTRTLPRTLPLCACSRPSSISAARLPRALHFDGHTTQSPPHRHGCGVPGGPAVPSSVHAYSPRNASMSTIQTQPWRQGRHGCLCTATLATSGGAPDATRARRGYLATSTEEMLSVGLVLSCRLPRRMY